MSLVLRFIALCFLTFPSVFGMDTLDCKNPFTAVTPSSFPLKQPMFPDTFSKNEDVIHNTVSHSLGFCLHEFLEKDLGSVTYGDYLRCVGKDYRTECGGPHYRILPYSCAFLYQLKSDQDGSRYNDLMAFAVPAAKIQPVSECTPFWSMIGNKEEYNQQKYLNVLKVNMDEDHFNALQKDRFLKNQFNSIIALAMGSEIKKYGDNVNLYIEERGRIKKFDIMKEISVFPAIVYSPIVDLNFSNETPFADCA